MDNCDEKLSEILNSLKEDNKFVDGTYDDIEINKQRSQTSLRNESKFPEINNIDLNGLQDDSSGVLNRLKANILIGKKEREEQAIILDIRIEQLKIQGEAIKKQSIAYWNSISSNFTEQLRSVAQDNLYQIENQRILRKMNTISNIYENVFCKMVEVANGNMPDSMKKELIGKIVSARDKSIERVENDILAKLYSLIDKEDKKQ